jgi:hypothetical protein
VKAVTAIGYARVSTREQNPALQHDALITAGRAKAFTTSPPAPEPTGRNSPTPRSICAR